MASTWTSPLGNTYGPEGTAKKSSGFQSFLAGLPELPEPTLEQPKDDRNLFQKGLSAVLDNPVGKAVTTTLMALDIPRSVTLSTLVELDDILRDDGFNLDDWASQAFGSFGVGDEPSIGVGDLLEDTDLPHPLKQVLGFAGDVAVDPLTYASIGTGKLAGGAGKLSTEALEAAARAGAKGGGRRMARGLVFRDQVLDLVRGNERVYKPLVAELGKDQVDDVLERVARQHSAAPLREIRGVLDPIMQDVYGGGLRTGLSFGIGNARLFVGGETLADRLTSLSSRVKDRTVRSWIKGDPRFEITKGLRAIKKSGAKRPYLEAYDTQRTIRGGVGARTEFRSHMDNALRALDDDIGDVDENLVIAQIENLDPQNLRGLAFGPNATSENVAAYRIVEFLEFAAREHDRLTGVAMPRLKQFFPHQQSREMRELLAEGHRKGLPRQRWGKQAKIMERKYKAGDEFLGVKLETGSLDEIHSVAKTVIGDDYVQVFETQLRPVLRQYAHNLSNAVMWDRIQQDAAKFGIAKHLPKEASEFLRKYTKVQVNAHLAEGLDDLADRPRDAAADPKVVDARTASNNARAKVAKAVSADEFDAYRQASTDVVLADDLNDKAADAAARLDLEDAPEIVDDAVRARVEDVERAAKDALEEVSVGGRSLEEADALLRAQRAVLQQTIEDMSVADEAVQAASAAARRTAKADKAAAASRFDRAQRALDEVSAQAELGRGQYRNWARIQEAVDRPDPAVQAAQEQIARLDAQAAEFDSQVRAAQSQLDTLNAEENRLLAQGVGELGADTTTPEYQRWIEIGDEQKAAKAAKAEALAKHNVVRQRAEEGRRLVEARASAEGTPIPVTATGNSLVSGEEALRSKGVLGGGLDAEGQQRLVDELASEYLAGEGTVVRVIPFEDAERFGARLPDDWNGEHAYALAFRGADDQWYIGVKRTRSGRTPALAMYHEMAHVIANVKNVGRRVGHGRSWENWYVDLVTAADAEVGGVLNAFRNARTVEEVQDIWRNYVGASADGVVAGGVPPKNPESWAARVQEAADNVGEAVRELEKAEARVLEQARHAKRAAGRESQERNRLAREISQLEEEIASARLKASEVADKRQVRAKLYEASDLLGRAANQPDPDLSRVARLEAQAAESEAELIREFGAASMRAQSAANQERQLKWLQSHVDEIYDVWDRGFRQMADGRWMLPETHEAFRMLSEVQKIEPVALLRAMDGVTARWKAWALISPGFHIRNFTGGYFNNLLDSVRNVSYHRFGRAYRQWRRELRRMGGYKNGADLYDALRGIKDKKVRGIFEEMLDGADFLTPQGNALSTNVRDTYDVRELASRGGSRGALARVLRQEGDWVGRKLDPTDMEFALIQWNFMGAGGVERHLRGTQYLDNRLRGLTPDASWDKVRKFHFNYDELSDIEIRWGRRLVPFYTWTRKNFPLQLEMMFRRPGVYQAVNHFRRNLSLGVAEDDVTPGYYEELMAAATPWTVGPGGLWPEYNLEQPTGDDARIYATLDLPFRDLAKTLDTGNILSSLNPVLKIPLEVTAGKSYFTDIPFSDYLVDAPSYPGSDLFYSVLEIMDGNFGLPRVVKSKDGTWQWRAVDAYKVENALPILGKTHKLSGILPGFEAGKETYENRSLQYTLSTLFGISTATNDPTAQGGEIKQRERALEAAIARARGESY